MADYQFTSLFANASDVLVITIGARRTDGGHITDAQKNAAMDAAKAVLQIVGANVEANSTAILTNSEVEEGQVLNVTTDVSVLVSGDAIASVDASVDEIPEYDDGEAEEQSVDQENETEIPEYDPENPTDGGDRAAPGSSYRSESSEPAPDGRSEQENETELPEYDPENPTDGQDDAE